MSSKTQICQNCKNQFEIGPGDLVFYDKIQVPPPTWCDQCRLIRRFMWRNERSLYRRNCDLCKRSIISIYSPRSPYTVYCGECFHGDGWDPLSYGTEIDFSRPFFEQFQELQLKVPRLYAFVVNNVASEYANGAAFNKNCYLVFVSDYNEDSMYSYSIMHSKNVVDCYNCLECELCYGSIGCTGCNRVIFSEDCTSCQNVILSKNCVNCQDCVGCVNLKNARYHIWNQPYSKEEYQAKLKELRLDTREGLAAAKIKLQELASKYPSKYIHGSRNVNVTGDYISNSKGSSRCYDADKLEDCKNINHADNIKDCHDAYSIINGSHDSYEVVSATGLSNVKFGLCVWTDFDTTYSDTVENCNNLFGCVSLRKKQYCILNKQYTKEEYEELLPRMIKHMNDMPFTDPQGRGSAYGDFFPMPLCPFGYNETVAQEYFPLTEKEALAMGYRWTPEEKRDNQPTKQASGVPQSIAEITDQIVNEIIGCEHAGTCSDNCTMAFRIHPEELRFYRQMNLPIPTTCFNCRHAERFLRKNPPRLWSRQCGCVGQGSGNKTYSNVAKHFHEDEKCPNTFETTYASDRPEIVYCEPCYQAEMA